MSLKSWTCPTVATAMGSPEERRAYNQGTMWVTTVPLKTLVKPQILHLALAQMTCTSLECRTPVYRLPGTNKNEECSMLVKCQAGL